MTATTKKILIVEDDRASLELLQYILCPRYEVLTSNRGEYAVRLAKKSKPDLVLLDFMLPDIQGPEVCRQLKEDPLTASIPILILSAVVSEPEIEAVFRAGAIGYIFKPFEAKQIIAKIESILDKS